MTKERLLTVRQVADQLGMSPAFVRGEICKGRLVARVEIRRPGGRTHRKVSAADLRDYRRVWVRSAQSA